VYSQKSNYPDIKSLLDADAKDTLDDSVLDDQLWLLLCDRINTPSDLQGLPLEISHYYASRLIQWEIGNGGFSQAAYNVSEWFLPSAIGYEILGKSDFANLVREANNIIPSDQDDLDNLEEEFEAFDERLSDIEWEIDESRIAYVRKHRQVFIALGGNVSQDNLLHGKWTGSGVNSRGDVTITSIEIRPNFTFIGEAKINDKPFWSYSGTWTFNGMEIVWNYTNSSVPLPDTSIVDTDEVVRVDSINLVLKSKLSGQQHIFIRTK